MMCWYTQGAAGDRRAICSRHPPLGEEMFQVTGGERMGDEDEVRFCFFLKKTEVAFFSSDFFFFT